MDEKLEFLEELDLPDLEGQDVVVEMVVQKVSQEADTEEEEDDAENQEADTEEEGDDAENQGGDDTANQGDDLEEEGDDAEDQEETGEKEKITIQLNSSSAPVTAANFVDLVEQNFYDSLAFHRFEEGFVIQGGDPQGRDPDFPIGDLGGGGYIDPETGEEREIPLEIQVAETEEIVYNEIVDDPVTLSHEAGVIAMARSNVLDTASSQFYFALEDISNQLDGAYSVFGEVTENFDFVQEIREGDRILIATVVEGNIPSRVSEIVTDSDLLNEYANKDGENKVSYILSMDDDSDDSEISVSNDSNNPEIDEPIDTELVASQLTETIDEEVSDEGDEETSDEETSDEETSDEETEENDDEGDEIASDISEDDANEPSDGDDILEIAQVDDSSVMMGLEGDDEIQGSDGNDLISGNQGDDSLFGLEGNDWLRGGKGDDELIGGVGDDYLIGDYGADILTGGAGADSFILRTDVVENDEVTQILQANRITDFTPAEDRIIVIAEFIPADGLVYELVDADTVIRLVGSNFILGVVEETSIEDVQDNIFAVNPDDYALSLG
ncbi:peptidylprolyl isomerase [Okeania sp. SIO3I5]|uniref:peptidylprolyl isomerase n=1 Tax=Okeania sp. SIO3I5 TaxID=2607805 RepID=UPI0025FAB465|nr:peptidylprolyl isomerase [Okeania sp. SIO3I5]